MRIANAFCWLNLLKNVYRFRIIRTALWMIPTTLTHLSKNAFKEHFSQVVKKIELHEDGMTATVFLLSGAKRVCKTTDFRPAK